MEDNWLSNFGAVGDEVWKNELGQTVYSASGRDITDAKIELVERLMHESGAAGHYDALLGAWRDERNNVTALLSPKMFRIIVTAYERGWAAARTGIL